MANGQQTAFYFAFMQTYILALLFPAVTGVLAWLFLERLSMAYAVSSTVWCIVFLEYWRLEEISLSLRWKTRGVGSLKVIEPHIQPPFDTNPADQTPRSTAQNTSTSAKSKTPSPANAKPTFPSASKSSASCSPSPSL